VPLQRYGLHEGFTPLQPTGATKHAPFDAPLKPRLSPLHTSQPPAQALLQQ
jgi:hypothetical protein